MNKLDSKQISSLETTKILKKSIKANSALAGLNAIAKIIPNQNILINSLVLQEAKDSSEIENIITTHDELYRANFDLDIASHQAKEVQRYKEALLKGFDLITKNNLFLLKDIIAIQGILEQNNAGIRKQSGTVLRNLKTQEIIYTPPQDYEIITELLTDLEKYINEPNDIDPLISMAIIHHRFETIHPFYDGNGRTGRIINILYLVFNGLLDTPILYLSSYIIKHKELYYKLLQQTREQENYHEWVMFILDGIERTSKETILLIEDINHIMLSTKENIKKQLPKIYTKDLIETIFIHPYTKIDFLIEHLNIHRQTASKYLNQLEKIGVLKSVKIKNSKFFINTQLFQRLQEGLNYDEKN